ncbi:hypothetical protein [Saccharothrix deserti]|uniref:hypothetical protein n=1 Tax=Saccharothrix deserti TaxID=2593674 RepID=UPI00131D6C8A|nr:hypothetical protein [Saccharothrix deserti]
MYPGTSRNAAPAEDGGQTTPQRTREGHHALGGEHPQGDVLGAGGDMLVHRRLIAPSSPRAIRASNSLVAHPRDVVGGEPQPQYVVGVAPADNPIHAG